MAQSDELTPQVERERVEAARGAGGLEGDWPPDWMVTYSDMTTILMTFFVLWYALTTAKVDRDLLKMKDADDEKIRGGTARATMLDLATEEEQRLVEKFQMLEREDQRVVLIEMRTLREKAEEVRKFIAQGNLENDVRIEVNAEDVVIIPTAPLIFPEGKAAINPRFYPILDKIASL